MFQQIIFPLLLILLLPVWLRLLVRLRLGPALIYVVLGNTVWLDWAARHTGRYPVRPHRRSGTELGCDLLPPNQINLHQINRRGVHCASLFCLEVTYGNTHQS